MYEDLYDDFLAGNDTLRIYEGSRLIFSSGKDRLLPLLEYLDSPVFHPGRVVVFDKILGNAATLLAVIAGCREAYSPLGSRYAIETLEKHDIEYHFTEVVPYIQQPGGEICPMEKLSLGKTPEEFHAVMKDLVRKGD
jgi:hypothetical protein